MYRLVYIHQRGLAYDMHLFVSGRETIQVLKGGGAGLHPNPVNQGVAASRLQSAPHMHGRHNQGVGGEVSGGRVAETAVYRMLCRGWPATLDQIICLELGVSECL